MDLRYITPPPLEFQPRAIEERELESSLAKTREQEEKRRKKEEERGKGVALSFQT